MNSERIGRYAVSAFLVVAGLFLTVGSLTLPVSQTLFGSEALSRAFFVIYSLSMLTGGVLLLSRPRTGCLIPVVALAFASIVILVGVDVPLWYRLLTAAWGLGWAALGLVWRRRLPAR